MPTFSGEIMGEGDSNNNVEIKTIKLSTILPLELSLVIYGISSLVPGDVFNIDYLPEQYRDKTYFQVMNVEHSVDSSGWKTTLQTQLRVRQNSKIYSSTFKRPDIFLSTRSQLLSSKLHPKVKESFMDFIVDSLTTDIVLVFKVKIKL